MKTFTAQVEAFLSGILRRSFRLVEGQLELGRRCPRPRRILFRMSAAENDVTVRVNFRSLIRKQDYIALRQTSWPKIQDLSIFE